MFFCIFLCYRVKLVRDFSNFVSDILPLNSPFWQFAWFALFWFQIAVSKRTVTPFVDIKFPRYFEFSYFSIFFCLLLIPDFFVNIYFCFQYGQLNFVPECCERCLCKIFRTWVSFTLHVANYVIIYAIVWSKFVSPEIMLE